MPCGLRAGFRSDAMIRRPSLIEQDADPPAGADIPETRKKRIRESLALLAAEKTRLAPKGERIADAPGRRRAHRTWSQSAENLVQQIGNTLEQI